MHRVPSLIMVAAENEMRIVWAALFSLPVPLCAAPLDAFLSADTRMRAGEVRLELAYDAVNSTLDVFNVRANDPVYGGTSVGDYSGWHLRGIYELSDRLSIDGGLWQRKIGYRQDTHSISSWQAAAQYRFFEHDHSRDFSSALRMGVWGNSADSLSKSTPTTLQGQTLDTLNVVAPNDLQKQVDLLGTWRPSDKTYWSAFVGTGTSRVAVDSMTATLTDANGCVFNLVFTPGGTVATLAEPCGDLLEATVSTPTNVLQELSYDARYSHAGTMLQWRDDDWQLSGGYHFQKLNRGGVDDRITGRGGTAYRTNRIVVGEILRKVGRNAAVFARAQLMSNQFVGEIPFTYNAFTAGKFDRRYGFMSFGVLFAL